MDNLNEMTIAELTALAEEKEIDVSGCKLKSEFVSVIEAALAGTEETEPVFTKEQLKNSKKFAKNKDIVSVVLKEGESYTIAECEALVNTFLTKECKRSVK